ncbi:MAG TPA: aminotransferase class V-fold PLP-dependent enzyme [Elusimicrobiales bacterium]|nr:aminotransferase class V-fold PLP-dependent enzyme [Elusimicrobiales bacterium]
MQAAADLRSLFLLSPDVIFLNHGSFGACPKEVFEAYQRWQLELERNPVEFLGRRSGELLWNARAELGQFLNAGPQDLVFIANSTAGVNAVAKSLRLGAGDEVLSTDHEYGACDNTWELACRAQGAKYLKAHIPLPYDKASVADTVWRQVTPRTRVLFFSHVTSGTALPFPAEELCARARAAGILTLVDGAHAPGLLDLDLSALGADFYVGNCHKWLLAPKGSAFLYARESAQALTQGLVTSWGYSARTVLNAEQEAYAGTRPFERKHQWQGTRDIAAFLAVPAALEFRRKYGWAQRRAACRALAAEAQRAILAANGLAPAVPEEDALQMRVIPVPAAGAGRLRKWLFDVKRIEIPVTAFGDSCFVRISVQPYNTPADMEALVRALREFYSSGGA